MRIVIVGAAYPLRGGIAHHTGLLYRELSKRHDVRVITFARQYPSLLFPGKTQMEPDDTNHIPSEQLIDSINPLNWFSVGKEIRRHRPELIIIPYSIPFFGPCYGTIARTAARETSTKVMLLCHNIIPHERRPGDTLFTSYMFNAADYFIVQSDAVEHDLTMFRPGATYRKIPHPVYSMFGSPGDKRVAQQAIGIETEHVILFFGYVRAYKGVHILLDAMAQLKQRFSVTLLLVGEFYDDQEKYMTQIRSLGLESCVTVHSDYVPNDEVALYFSAADAVVLPYLSATQSGIAQIAYNFDKPVIASNSGGLAEVVRDGLTGYLVKPNSADALAGAIARFFEENKESEFVANVRMEKKRYTWEAMAKAIEELVGQ